MQSQYLSGVIFLEELWYFKISQALFFRWWKQRFWRRWYLSWEKRGHLRVDQIKRGWRVFQKKESYFSLIHPFKQYLLSTYYVLRCWGNSTEQDRQRLPCSVDYVTIMQLHYREECCIPLWSLSLSGARKDLKDEWKQAKQRKMGERMLWAKVIASSVLGLKQNRA